MPYYLSKLAGTTIITMPTLTQAMGPWIRYPSSQNYYKKVSLENEVFSKLIDSLPPHGYFYQRFSRHITNWLPFYWNGFEETTRYTYVLDDLTDPDRLYKNIVSETRREMAKAQGDIDVVTSDDVKSFYELNVPVFKKQGMEMPYTLEQVKRLDAACSERGVRKIFVAKDKSDEVHAALHVVWNEETFSGLLAGINPKFQSDGAYKLLTWEAIRFASTVSKHFDFNGSMLRPVERNNRSFGAVQVPYYSVSKVISPHLKVAKILKGLMP
jgi:lipid II:glycine glycyltransferase (peptidoglycan interpeptide bridge formation enzyme)